MSKLSGGTSHRAIVVSYQALYFNLGVQCFGIWVDFLAIESTELNTFEAVTALLF